MGIQPEINFVQTSAEQSDDITVIYDDLFLGGTQKKAKLDYLKFAGLLNIDLGPSQRVKLQLGPQWGMLLNEAVDSLKTPQDVFKKSEFSVLGGIMLQLPLIHIGTRYEIGLTDINGIDNQDQMEKPGMAVFCGDYFISNLNKKFFSKTLPDKHHPPIFALPNSNGDFYSCLRESESNYSLTIITW